MIERVEKLVKPFYNWKPELGPALADLKERVKQAIFWNSKISGAIAVSRKTLSLFWSGRRISLGDYLLKTFGEELKGILSQRKLDELRLELEEKLPFGPKQGGFVYEDMTIDRRLDASLKECLYGLDGLERQFTLRREMQLNFWHSLFLSAGFCLAGDESKNFKPLRELWRRGNFPAWFNWEKKLIVFCQQPF